MQLKSEGRNLINQSIVTDAQELLNFLEIEANGTAKLKVHDCELQTNIKNSKFVHQN